MSMKAVFNMGLVVIGLAMAELAFAEVFPEEGPPGTTVTISGAEFGPFTSTQQNRVEFNGVPALIQLWEPDFIMVKVPLKATSGPVVVINGETRHEAGAFRVQQIEITRVEPAEVEAGATLTIYGKHFGPTAGSRDPNTMFGVNQVLISGVRAEVRKWRPNKIEVVVPANASSGEVEVRLASSDPLPDGSCCAPVEYAVSNRVYVTVVPPVSIQPTEGPIGSKVILSGQNFGETRPPQGRVLIGGVPATIAQWSNRTIVVHVPLNARSGPVVLHLDGTSRQVGEFIVQTPEIVDLRPQRGPIGTLVTIKGKHFGVYSESGSTAYAFDFDPGANGVEIGGVPAIIHRWNDEQIDVWVPFSAKSGPVIIKRGATIPHPDGTCCLKKDVVKLTAGEFTVVTPRVDSYAPKAAGLDEIVTITGSGFGEFIKISESARLSLHRSAHDWKNYRLGADVSRSEVLINGVAAVVVSWTDTEIKVRVPRRNLFGIGNPEGFEPDLSHGELVIKRGSWDLLENGQCCTPKKWLSVVAGPFTILKRGLPNPDYYTVPNPRRD